MSIRQDALRWYAENYGEPAGNIFTSKYYRPEESWPKKALWWFQIPKAKINPYVNDDIFLICQAEPGANSFHMLAVPMMFFYDHLNSFHQVGDMLSLYLSADSNNLFVEFRGEGSLNFSQFFIS